MRVVQFSTSDLSGGASVSAFRLHKGLIAQGVDTRLLVVNRYLTEPTIETVTTKDRLKVRAVDWWNARQANRYRTGLPWSFDRGAVNPLSYPFVREAEAYIVHWVGLGFLDCGSLERLLQTGKPVLLVLHDLFFLTGGCPYPMRCQGFKGGCRECPLLRRGLQKEAMHQLRAKHKLFHSYPNLYLVANSEWTAEQVRASWATRDLPVNVIPMPLDEQVMRCSAKKVARRLLGIPKSSKVLLFGADNGTSNPYKGWHYLVKALAELDLSEWTVITVGNRSIVKEQLPFKAQQVLHYDRLYDPLSLSVLYNAANLFVMPSLVETFGKMAYEAISCGTPVVCYRAGGLTERMTEGVNAWIAEQDEDEVIMTLNLIEALREGMTAVFSVTRERSVARRKLLRELGLTAVTKRFIALLRQAGVGG